MQAHLVFEAARWRAGEDALDLLVHRVLESSSGKENREIVLPQHLAGLIAGQLLGEGAEVDDGVVRAQDDDHALGGLDQVAEGGLAPFLGQGEVPPLGDAGQAGAEASALSGLRM